MFNTCSAQKIKIASMFPQAVMRIDMTGNIAVGIIIAWPAGKHLKSISVHPGGDTSAYVCNAADLDLIVVPRMLVVSISPGHTYMLTGRNVFSRNSCN